jgi:hydrogenase small subunit
MGALAAAVGLGQAELANLSQAFAGHIPNLGGTLQKPRVVWVHGAECTGCSTSLLGFLEDLQGAPLNGSTATSFLTTQQALGLAGVTNAANAALGTDGAGLPIPNLTLTAPTRTALWGAGATDVSMANIADVVIDVVDLQYHETIMAMGGDLAAQWLHDFAAYTPTGLPADATKPGEQPFVLVVEGALQDKTQGGAWSDTAGNGVSWCSIGLSDDGTSFENDMADTVLACANKSTCIGIIPIGQCATYGGYPGCKPPITSATAAGFNPALAQSGAMGTYDYLSTHGASAATLAKVINVPGCPTNPYWFCLTVVLFLISKTNPSVAAQLNLMKTDYGRRLKAVYPVPVHSPYCPRYTNYANGVYASKVGDPGCLQKIGCKGIGTYSFCGLHGWNNQQPQNVNNSAAWKAATGTKGGHCTRAGAPCMACTEKGYPDSFVPFVKK